MLWRHGKAQVKVSVRRDAVVRTNVSMRMRVRVCLQDVGIRFRAREGVGVVAR